MSILITEIALRTQNKKSRLFLQAGFFLVKIVRLLHYAKLTNIQLNAGIIKQFI